MIIFAIILGLFGIAAMFEGTKLNERLFAWFCEKTGIEVDE